MTNKHEIGKQVRYSRLTFDALSAIFFIFIMAIFPLYITRTNYMMITKQKTDFFIILTAVTTVAALAAVFLILGFRRLKNYNIENEPNRRISVSEWALIAFMLLTLASAVFSPWQNIVWNGYTQNGITGRWEGFWVFLCYAITFVIIARYYKPRKFHFIIVAVSVILLSFYGVLQFVGLDILELTGFFIPIEGLPPYEPLTRSFRATIGNINIVSAYCSLTAVLFAFIFSSEREDHFTKSSILYIAASILSFALLLISQGESAKIGVFGVFVLLIPFWVSDRRRLGRTLVLLSGWIAVYISYKGYFYFAENRAALERGVETSNTPAFLSTWEPVNYIPFIILFVITLVSGLFILKAVKKWPEKPTKIAGFSLLAAVIVVGLLFVEFVGPRWENQPGNIVWQAREILHGRVEDTFGSNRGWVWKRGLSVIPDNPLLGTGPDTFYYALGNELQAESVALMGVTFDKAHNSFLQIAVCLGLPALAAYLIFLGGLIVPSLKKMSDRPVMLAFCAASISFIIQSFFEVDTPIDRPLLWAVMGVIAGELWREKIGVDSFTPSFKI